jgi:magnesium chelatase family protein
MSFSKTYSTQVSGLRADIITIEVDLSNGLHSFSIVGLGDRAVEEAKDRISAAIKNSGFVSPKQRNQKVVISLSPADIRKEGVIFDLGMAVGYLLAAGEIHFDTNKTIFIGELSLEGNTHAVHGVLAMIMTAKQKGFEHVFVPKNNAIEAALVSGITIYPLNSLMELVDHISGKIIIRSQPRTKIMSPGGSFDPSINSGIDFKSIYGNEAAKRALEIAAVGKHNIAMYGPPGTGKTMLAKAFSGILPTLSHAEVLEVSQIHSIAKITKRENATDEKIIITRPPFRAPHHTSPYSAIIGGGNGTPKPGEITLAHRGVIFLDEFTEFDRRTIDSLRQPMEEKKITITRTKESISYPADCIYILAMNPCACGGKKCLCTNNEIERYRKKISGPIADRIDIWISVSKVEYAKFHEQKPNSDKIEKNSSEIMAKRIKNARIFKNNRNKNNANLIEADAFSFFKKSAEKLALSGRSYTRTLNVARTIADLEQSEKIKKEHIMEALQYRKRN